MGSSLDEIPHALVVPFPSPGQGHVVGGMPLSQSLAAVGFKVSIIYFSSYYARLKETNRLVLPSAEFREDPFIVENSSSCKTSGGSGSGSGGGGGVRGSGGGGKIRLFVVEDGFAPGDINKRMFVTPTMKENLYNHIVVYSATCIISDSFLPWTLEVAQRAGIPRIELCTSNALAYHVLIHLHVLFSEGIFPEKGSPTQLWKIETSLMLSHIPGLPPFSSQLIPADVRFTDSSSPHAQFSKQIASCVKSGDRILIHTLSELEPDAFKAFEVQGIPAYAIGPLPTQMKMQEEDHSTECLSWLNLQAECSVIYVAFGSVAKLSVEEMQELAMGLEASGSPFLWVVRDDAVKMEELPQVLPGGFLARTSGKGMFIRWAPQVEVLAHKAIGGFLSHCGWNSTMESLWAGVPILCCPRFAEQRFNTHYLCNKWGAGLELGRTDTGGLERSFVELGVKALLHGEDGLKARSKAQEIMHLFKRTSQQEGRSFSNLQKLYDDMKALCLKAHSNPSKEALLSTQVREGSKTKVNAAGAN